MERRLLLRHLEQADGHVLQAEKIVANQRYLINRLERAGGDSGLARQLVQRFEAPRDAFIAHRDLIQRGLEKSQ